MIKSPVLSRLQDKDIYSFCMVMNQYLQTAITLYNPNLDTQKRASDIVLSSDSYTNFVGDGSETEFDIVSDIELNEDSILQVMVGGEIVTNFTYKDKKITFTEAPGSGVEIDISWMNDGYFNSLNNEDVTLLSMALCWAWAIQTQNNQLDIDRQPSDSDFKLHAEGTTLGAKIDWVKHFEEMYHRELSKADWRPFFRRTR